jgi:phenylacetate-CoA ligase
MDISTRDPLEYMALLNAKRFEKLKKQIRYCFGNADYYCQRFLEAGVDSPDAIDSLDAFRRLPAFLDKARHRESQQRSLDRYGHPYGLHLTVPLDQVIHVAATAGTTGHPTFYVFTRKDLDITATVLGRSFRAAGIEPGDTVLHAFGLSLWLAGITFVQALETYGARPIAVGAEGGIPKILRTILLTRPRALFATPSLVSHLIERAPEEIGRPVGDLGIRIIFCAGEPGAGMRAFRERIRETYGATVFDATGGAWHNATISCDSPHYHGMHYMAEDYCFRYDLVDPETKAPLELRDGAVGEAIHTALEYEAAPAFRNATGDIVKLHVGECPGCGAFGARMEIVGRVDDLLNVKGVKVYPASIQEVVSLFQPEVSGQLRIRLNGPPPRVEPPLRVIVEAGGQTSANDYENLARAIEKRTHELLTIRPKVTVVAFGTFTRSSQKTQLIEIAEP